MRLQILLDYRSSPGTYIFCVLCFCNEVLTYHDLYESNISSQSVLIELMLLDVAREVCFLKSNILTCHGDNG